MEQKLVSIVVPIYNVEKYLERCLLSIVNQSYGQLEIILVDDGSPDGCPQLCDQWAGRDARIKVVHKQNAGLGMARNTGMEYATGEYIFFFDSDDYVDTTLVEKAVECAERNQADIVVYGLNNVNSRGETERVVVPCTQKDLFENDEVHTAFLPDLIDCSCRAAENKDLVFSAWSCMYRMELIRRVGWRFVSERQIISEDSFSLIWLYKHIRRVAVLPEPMYFYCRNDASLTQTYRADRFDRCKHFYADTSKMAGEQGYGEEIQRRIAGLFFSFVIAAMKQIVAAPLGWQEKRNIIKTIVADEQMQKALGALGDHYAGGAKGILIRFMRKKKALATWCLVCAKVICEARRS